MSIAPPREAWHLGIIGGSGLAAIDGLEDAQDLIDDLAQALSAAGLAGA